MHRLLHPLFALLASATRQDLARQVAYLKAENRILRARLPKRIHTTERERTLLVKAGRKLGLQLKTLLSITSYSSFLRWVREMEARPLTGTHRQNRKPGRPRTPEDIRALILRMRKESNFGYTRILGELKKVGLKISRQTVKNILKEAGLTPDPDRTAGETWDAFLARHAETLWQCDFVTKPMWTPKGLVDLYFLVFLHLGTRRCWISPCTRNPKSAWVTQQAKTFLVEAQDDSPQTRIVMRDNDAKYTQEFDQAFEQAKIKIQRNTPRSPNLRAHVERFIQSLQVECLDKFVIVAERHLNYINREWSLHYNRERPHEGRNHLPPGWEKAPERAASIRARDVVCTTRLGGVLKSYERRAA